MKRQRIAGDRNVFGRWVIYRWPAMPPEAPHPMYSVRWSTATDHGTSHHPTEAAARAAIPITNEGVKQCPMATLTRLATASCATDRPTEVTSSAMPAEIST